MKNNKNISIVIPSYNEVKNLSILIKSIFKELPEARIIIVDDSSKEENDKLITIVAPYKNILLKSRLKKDGRGSAVIEGFRYSLNNKTMDYVFEMDSDLAHDPKEFKRFIHEINVYPYDLVIGSRYKSGGKIKNIEKNRTIMSRFINYFLYFWLNIKISDYTSGFRLYSRNAVEFITKQKLKSRGFITLSEIAYLLYKNGYSISEVPITWNYRRYGKSNVNLQELLNSLIFVILLKVG
ncbi:glycosyltransferase [Patescibacteria group bacterium]|nr:glycosyltransferase [Patescibacteria group bacterium]